MVEHGIYRLTRHEKFGFLCTAFYRTVISLLNMEMCDRAVANCGLLMFKRRYSLSI